MAIVVDQMRGNLLTIEQVQDTLSNTEPLSTEYISSDTKIMFKLDPMWGSELDTLAGTEPAGALMRINGADHRLTKDAALQAGANFGYSAALMKRMPADLAEKNLNYWYSGGMGNDDYNVLSVGDNIAAFTRPTLVPFSNLELLDNALQGIAQKYGSSAEVLADYKISNSLQQTDIRLIVPEQTRAIKDSGMSDVETGEDLWSAGLHLSNSLIGKTQTTLEAYLFRWWCTNGMTTMFKDVGTWSRRSGGQEEMSVYEWARTSVDEILGGLEGRFDEIQALTQLNVSGSKTGDALKEIYTDYRVPITQRNQISQAMIEADEVTLYTVMNAITQTANAEGLDPSRADTLMRIGGAIPTTVFDTLKAKVWREGHAAKPAAANPYEIAPV